MVETGKGGTAAPSRWRKITVWVLIAVATVLGLASALTVWVQRQALDTNAVTKASSKMLENDAGQGCPVRLPRRPALQQRQRVPVAERAAAEAAAAAGGAPCGRAAAARDAVGEHAALAASRAGSLREGGAHGPRGLHPGHRRQGAPRVRRRRRRLSRPAAVARPARRPDRHRQEARGEAAAQRGQDRDHEEGPARRDPDGRERDQGAQRVPRHRRVRAVRGRDLPRPRLQAIDAADRRRLSRRRRSPAPRRPPRGREHAHRHARHRRREPRAGAQRLADRDEPPLRPRLGVDRLRDRRSSSRRSSPARRGPRPGCAAPSLRRSAITSRSPTPSSASSTCWSSSGRRRARRRNGSPR